MSENKDGGNSFAGYPNFDEFSKEAFQALVEGTRAANNLPKNLHWNYYTTYPSFEQTMESQGNQILNLIDSILKHQSIQGNVLRRNIDDKLEMLVDCNDSILERVGKNLDELAGLKTVEEQIPMNTSNLDPVISGSWNKPLMVKVNNSIKGQKAVHLMATKNIIRPQSLFKDKIDNSSETPWQPRIKDKPNSIKPLAIFLEECSKGIGQRFSHPYELELENFKPPDSLLTPIKPIYPKQLNDVPLKIVDNLQALNEMYKDLLNYNEIAIDLEHHSYRSFQGITCLMQVSTGDTDYLVDTLVLRNDLEILNEVFTKPTVVKIFHGADFDVEWLQRDLSLYIVNMFDTHQAAKQLNYGQLSLAALLNKFCQVDPDKTYQLADWRIRPLPEELKHYAREDTHYLIYIYHMLRNELIQKSKGGINDLMNVINRSTQICKKIYTKPVFSEEGYMELYRSSRRAFDNRQNYALKELFRWRDHIARDEDESFGYVLPTHMMLNIAETLPREVQGIIACCNPVPPLVRHHLVTLHEIILKARQQPLIQPILKEEPVQRTTQQWFNINMENPLHCPHDLSKQQDFRDDFSTLLNQKNGDTFLKQCQIENSKSNISVFNTYDEDEQTKSSTQKVKFLCPFERYKLVQLYIKDEQKKVQDNKKNKSSKEDKDVPKTDNTEKLAKLYESLNKNMKWVTEEEKIEVQINETKSVSEIKVNETINESEVKVNTTENKTVESVENNAVKKDVISLRNLCKKRKREELSDSEEEEENVKKKVDTVVNNDVNERLIKFQLNVTNVTPKQNKWVQERKNKKMKNKNKNKNANANTNANVNANEIPKQNSGVQGKKNKKKKNKNRNNQMKKATNKNNQMQNATNRNNQMQNATNRNNQMQNATNSNNKRKEFKPFDYSQIDYNRFRGGSNMEQNKRNEHNSMYKGKKPFRQNRKKANNKMFSFDKPNMNMGGNRKHKKQ